MRIITVTNQKGGVAKSTTAHALGGELLKNGYKVLYVDLDIQGNLSYMLGASTRTASNAYTILENHQTTQEAIQHLVTGDVIASSPQLIAIDTALKGKGKEYHLKLALDEVKGMYDYCIIDTPPAISLLTVNALACCDEVITPTQADILSMQGITQLADTIQSIRLNCNPCIKWSGILICRFSRSSIKRLIIEHITEYAQHLGTHVFYTYIRECTAIQEAQTQRAYICNYSPRSNGAKDYHIFYKELINEKDTHN